MPAIAPNSSHQRESPDLTMCTMTSAQPVQISGSKTFML